MNILFICGSLESGKDGVGDYTRRLAGQLIKMRHSASIIAMSDKFVTEIIISNQVSETNEINTLRIPKSIPVSTQFNKMMDFIKGTNPDWISLQYVPFAFNDKGLPYSWTNFMELLVANKNLHIMFHELWVGMSKESSFKEKFWGTLQRKLIRSTITRLKPKLVNTQTQLYLDCLNQINCKATRLPLFGNIELNHNHILEGVTNNKHKSNMVKFIIFGGIHANAPVDSFAQFVASKYPNQLKEVKLILLGRCGAEQEQWIKAWEQHGMITEVLGEQPQNRISEELINADFGITTTPTSLIDKSGSVAAMLEHGLKVIGVARNWQPSNSNQYSISPGVVVYNANSSQNVLESFSDNQNYNTLQSVTNQFISNLQSINNG